MKKCLFATLVVTSLLLAACAPSAQQTAPTPTPQPPAKTEAPATEEPLAPVMEATAMENNKIPVEALRNATYSGIYDEPITLTDGLYEGQPYVEGDPSHPVMEYIDGVELYDDLDGDGAEDAVVFLLERGGGSGAFTYIAAQLNQDGKPVDAGAVRIEDRIGVKSAAIENGQVTLEIITQGPGDAACCGTHKAGKTYALQDGKLAEVGGSNGNLVRISAADLNGTNWVLVELDYDMLVLEDVNATLNFQDGQLAGFGSCNNYNSSFTLGEDNPLVMTIGPITATRMACPDPIVSQESAYFAALEGVSHWGYWYGKLALYYKIDGSEPGRMLFMQQAASNPSKSLVGQTWQWTSFTNPVEVYEIESPENYTVTFNADDTLNIKADCNMANASYTDEAGALQVKVGPSTLAMCPAESRSEQFIRYLGSAARYFFQDGKLYIDLFADGGTMEFTLEN